MRAATLLSALLLLAAVVGCLSVDQTDLQDEARPAPEAPDERASEPTIERDPIETRQVEGEWVAVQGINITNGLGGATDVRYVLAAPAGGISVDHREQRPVGNRSAGTGYWTEIVLRARGETEEQARQGVASMRLDHRDELSGQELRLLTKVTLPQDDPTNVTEVDPETLLGSTSTNRNARMLVHVPEGPHYTIDARTTAGGISVNGAFPTVRASTNAGGISLNLLPWASGTVTASAGAGGVSVNLAGGPDNGYDATAEATAGGVSVDIPDGEPVGEQSRNRQHVRTRGFDRLPVQTVIEASAEAGGVSITAS